MTQPYALFLIKKWLHYIFPISKTEIKKVFLLFLLKFLITHVFCILTTLKSTALVMSSQTSAEVIAILKACIITPISLCAFILYTRLNNILKQSTLFYCTILFFLGCFCLYGFVLYPYETQFTPLSVVEALHRYFNGRHLYWIAIFRYWIHVFFFVAVELWGQFVLVVLYWSFANSICTISEAKRFYAIFLSGGHLAMLLSGSLVLSYTQKYGMNLLLTMQTLLGYIVGIGLLSIMVYWLINNYLGQNKTDSQGVYKSEKLCLSFRESIKYVIGSSYLRNVAIMVIACNISMNIVDGTWKSYLKQICKQSFNYQVFTSKITFWTGVISFVSALLLSGNVIRKFGWQVAARVAPVAMGVLGCVFFFMSYAKHHLPIVYNLFGDKFVWYIVFVGGVHSVISKVVKYNFYDKTTQIAYIPLDAEAKIKGKAATDMLGSRFGKAGASWIQIILLELFNTHSIQTYSGILFGILCIITIFWFQAIHQVGKQLKIFEREETKSHNMAP